MPDHRLIQRLGETGVGNRCRQTGLSKLFRRRKALLQPCAEGKQRHFRAFTHNAALADLENLAAFGQVDSDAVATRIPERDRTGIMRRGRPHHVLQFRLVARRHDDEARQGRQKGRIEGAAMGCPVRADKTGAVDGKAHRQFLDRHVMHHLVIGALQEGRIDGAERLVAFACKPRGKGDGMLFGNADIEGALGKRLLENVDTRTVGHGRRNADDPVVMLGFLGQRLAEHLRIAGRIGRRLGLRAGNDVELGNAVILVGCLLCRGIALALAGHHMDQHRTLGVFLHVSQDRQQRRQVVPVDRSDVVETQFLEQRAAGDITAGMFHRPGDCPVDGLAEIGGQLLAQFPHAHIGAARGKPRQIGTHRSGGRCNRHVVVVENDDQPRIHGAGIVHRLERHAG